MKLDREKKSLLPLTKEELNRYITTFTCKRRTDEEKQTQKASCTTIILFLTLSLSLFYFDNIFRSILNSIHDNAYIRFKEVGHHELNITVNGDGSIAKLVRKLTNRLNSAYDMNRLSSTKKCLPETIETSWSFYLEFLYLCSAYILIDQISIYAMRLRHVTAGFFYPERERQRIEFLHRLIRIERRDLDKLGLSSFIGGSSVNEAATTDDVYTLRDALGYLRNCLSDSLTCCCCCRSVDSKPSKRY